LDEYLTNRTRYALLARLLTYPSEEEAGEGKERARFSGLSREQLAAYVRLAGAVEAEGEVPVDLPTDLMGKLLSGEPVEIQDAVAQVQQGEDDADGKQQEAVGERLVQVLRDPNHAVAERLSAGDALAELGDPRFYGEDGFYLPREEMLGFVEVPEGNFRMGSDDQDPDAGDDEKPQHTLHLPAFYMAKYPITVAQFRLFVDQSDHEPADKDSLKGAANHPVVWVNWHDALAYCRWLDEQLRAWTSAPQSLRQLLGNGYQVILPSEAEWEKAARGTGGLRYPWGNEFDPEQANFKGTSRGNPSAVGCFPGGSSPYRLLDMSGNVWEWTRSIYGEWDKDKNELKNAYRYEYEPRDGREDLEKGNEWVRVLRGGSWRDEPKRLRCAARDWVNPRSHGGVNCGFRVCLSPFS
jgi:formylglycine-generating enzyme required for sulfatase activity